MPEINFQKILIDGAIYSLIASIFLLGTMRINPRLFLHDYPKDVQNKVPSKTTSEKQLSIFFGIGFLIILIFGPFLSTLTLKNANNETLSFWVLLINSFGVAFIFNVVDWLILDWLLFCTIQPKFMIIPGSEGMPGYRNYWMHFRGFLIGSLISLVGGFIITTIVFFI
jgi:hypothetical protein